MFRRLTVCVLIPCLFLMSCTARRPQLPEMSAELQKAFDEGPLCPRLDGTNWPCSDTDGRLWKEWYYQKQAAEAEARADAARATFWQAVAGVALVATVGVLAAGASSYRYHTYYPSKITTRCSYGYSTSSCTTKYR